MAEETVNRPDLTPEEAETRAERRARLAQLLDRGLVHSRLDVELEDGRVIQWARETDEDITYYESIGYRLETEDNVKRARRTSDDFHGTGDTRVRVGDLVLMSTPVDNFEDIKYVQAERRKRRLSKNLGKTEFLEKALQDSDPERGGVPVIDESRTEVVRGG